MAGDITVTVGVGVPGIGIVIEELLFQDLQRAHYL